MAYDTTDTYHGYGNIPSMGLMCAYDEYTHRSWGDNLHIASTFIYGTYYFHNTWCACDPNRNVMISSWVPDYDVVSGYFDIPPDDETTNQFYAGYKHTKICEPNGTEREVTTLVNQPGTDQFYKTLGVW